VGYSGDRLHPCFKTGAVKETAFRMAEKGRHAIHGRVVVLTPVDTGELKASWRERPVLIVVNDHGEVVYESAVYTELDYAPDVEYGTGLWGPHHAKYLIEPKNPDGVLHWIGKDGVDRFARRVWHPGSPGAHMLAISVAETEAQLHALMEPLLHEWVKAQEAVMRAQK
jgi:hypothetical protein